MKNRIFEVFEPMDPLEESWGHETLLNCELLASFIGFR